VDDSLRKFSNLNRLDLTVEDWGQITRVSKTKSGNVTVFFDNLETSLIELISQANAVIGCVALLTNDQIFLAMSQKPASLIVQKEDFLRPDKVSKPELHRLYHNLDNAGHLYPNDFMVGGMGVNMQAIASGLNLNLHVNMLDSVRCLGNVRKGKAQAEALMHHKFLVFCQFEGALDEDSRIAIPYAVWTGSFNLTWNGTRSLENAVLIEDRSVAEAYTEEFLYLYAFSEKLNWESEWVEETSKFFSSS